MHRIVKLILLTASFLVQATQAREKSMAKDLPAIAQGHEDQLRLKHLIEAQQMVEPHLIPAARTKKGRRRS